MPDLGIIQLIIKFYTFLVQKFQASSKLAALPTWARHGISPLSQNAASLYTFTSLLSYLLATLWGWLLPTGAKWLLLNNKLSNEKSKILQNTTFVKFCCVASVCKRSYDSVGRSGLTNMKDTYVILTWLYESAIPSIINW